MVSSSSRRLLLLAVALYWAALFVATHLPSTDPAESDRKIPHLDKLVHAAAFAGLAVLVCSFAAVTWPPSPRMAAAVVGLLAAYGALDELTQGLVLSRYPSGWDWLADVVGAILGVLVFGVASRVLRSTAGTG
ncbi:MAG: VanZ family protein [Pirellulaceae bacterium]